MKCDLMIKCKHLFLFLMIKLFCAQLIFSQETINGEMWEYLEWEVYNPTYSGNPFDLIANIEFIHSSSGEIILSQMFYDSNDTWKFRFTGTKLGEWNYITNSSDPELDGLIGYIIISENNDLDKTGFLKNYKNKYAVQTNENSVKPFIFNVYMNQTNSANSFLFGDSLDYFNYALEAKDNGCSVIFSDVIANSWFEFPTRTYEEHSSLNPDPDTFEKIELMISAARELKLRVHIWAWGDEYRKMTPILVGEGINGEEDLRLQRYIAARLGPLPGWTMGYGFDLDEWVTKAQIQEWADTLINNMGWPHYLTARGIKINSPYGINAYGGFGREGEELTTVAYGPMNYEEVTEDLEADTLKPHLFEERNTYNRSQSPYYVGDWNLDMNGTRRLMWWNSMAGGMGCWFGFYPTEANAYDGYPYPNPEQLKTHQDFWITNDHFKFNLVRDSVISDGFGLRTTDNSGYIIYKEDADSIWINMETLKHISKIYAVDTKQSYSEIKVDNINENNFWKAPYFSDWVLVIGHFNSNYTELTTKIFLEGKHNSPDLDSNIIIPMKQPYNNYPWNYNGVEIVHNTKDNYIYDWILVELRSNDVINNDTLLNRRAAFLRSDGIIVDLDKTSPLKMYNLPDGEYYLVVYHRNHLSVMSKTPITLN